MMSTMIDDLLPAQDNIRTILYYLGQALDERLSHFRRGTIYETVRPSDVRVFLRALRQAQTISEIARGLGISRQAAQSSVHRLQAIQVLDLEAVPGNKRDKIVLVTPKGQHASNTARQQIKRFEAEFVEVIGEDGLAAFRKNLTAILEATRALNAADAKQAKLTPPA
jgi:DNA-binding MarR family transcriptional regulator